MFFFFHALYSKQRESILRISFFLLLVNALLFTQIVSAVDDDTKLKSALLKAIKTHDTATVTALANGGHEAIDRDDVLQEKIYEYLDAERQREIKAKEDAKAAAIAKEEAQEKARLDAIAAEEKKKTDAIAKQKAEAAAAAAAVAAKKAAEEKKKNDAIAAKKAAEAKKKQDAIAAKKAADAKAAAAAKQKADAEAAAAAVAAKKAADAKKKQDAIAAKKAADAKAKAAAQKKADTKTVAPVKPAAAAAPKVQAAPKAVVAAPVVAAPIVADDENDDEDEMTEEATTETAAEPAPITVSDQKLIGTWKQISSEKVITLVVEENRNFTLEQIEDDGTLTITGTWKSEENIFMMSIKKVQRNVHTRDTDIHRIYKVERLSAHRFVLRDKRNRIAYDLKR